MSRPLTLADRAPMVGDVICHKDDIPEQHAETVIDATPGQLRTRNKGRKEWSIGEIPDDYLHLWQYVSRADGLSIETPETGQISPQEARRGAERRGRAEKGSEAFGAGEGAEREELSDEKRLQP